MTKDSQPHILLLYHTLIPSVRLCGHCQIAWLAQQGLVAYRHKPLLRISGQDLSWADTVILGRLDDPFALKIAELLQRTGRQLLYILDDDLLHMPRQCASFSHYAEPGVQYRIHRILDLCTGIITPSPRLAERYLRPGQRLLMIEEPALEPIPYSPHSTEAVVIGFAGSPDRTKDIEDLLGAVLTRIHSTYPGKIRFEFFGAVPEFAAKLDSTVLPYCDCYDDYRKTLNSRDWDIGLAPMPDTSFHACKHYNKYCEYAAAGIVGIFSRVEPYTRLPAGYSGRVLCDNDPESWYRTLSGLVEDRAFREALREQASHTAHTGLSLATVAQDFADHAGNVLTFISSRRSISARFCLYKLLGLTQWAQALYGHYGLSIFKRIYHKMSKAFSGGQGHP